MSNMSNKRIQLKDLKIFCISLADAKERRESIQAMTRKLGLNLEFINAIDGRGKSRGEIQALSKRKIAWNSLNGHRDEVKTPTHAACSLSHITTWERIVNENLVHAIVIEDDVTSSNVSILNIPAEAEFVYLSNRASKNRNNEACGPICGSEAYYLTRTGAIKLLKINEELRMPVDIQWLPQIESLIRSKHFTTKFTDKTLPTIKAFVIPKIFTLNHHQHDSQVSPKQMTTRIMIPLDLGDLIEKLITLQEKTKNAHNKQLKISQLDIEDITLIQQKCIRLGINRRPQLMNLIHQLKDSTIKLKDIESKLLNNEHLDPISIARLAKTWRAQKLFHERIKRETNEAFKGSNSKETN